MPFYEVIITVSLTLALGIPTFFEKVMRGGYEKKVEQYKNWVFNEFRDVFVETYQDFNEVQEFTEDIEDKITDVANLWEESRINYHRLERLLEYRNALFIGWMIVFSIGIGALYSQFIGHNFLDIEWDSMTNGLFVILLGITIFFIYKITKFDSDLSKISERKNEEKSKIIDKIEDRTLRRSSFQNYIIKKNSEIIDFLLSNKIKFEKEVNLGFNRVDYVIPNSQSPKIVLEIKFTNPERHFPSIFHRGVVGFFASIKKDYPKIKTVLITNIVEIKPDRNLLEIKKFTDKIIYIDKIHELKEFIINNM